MFRLLRNEDTATYRAIRRRAGCQHIDAIASYNLGHAETAIVIGDAALGLLEKFNYRLPYSGKVWRVGIVDENPLSPWTVISQIGQGAAEAVIAVHKEQVELFWNECLNLLCFSN